MTDWKIVDPTSISDTKEKQMEKQTKEANIFFTPSTPSPNYDWLIEMANEENKMEEFATISVDIEENIEKTLKYETISFLKELKLKVHKLVKIFNSYKPETTSPIKLYRIENREADFVIFRNTIKLIFSMHSPGTIQITYNSYKGGLFAMSKLEQDFIEAPPSTSDYLQAQIGPFNEAIWMHNGQKINQDKMLKFYLERFIRESMK